MNGSSQNTKQSLSSTDKSSDQFMSLAELTNNHLNNKISTDRKFNTRPNFGRPLFGKKLNSDKDITSITNTLSDTSLTAAPKQLEICSSKSEIIENDWHIDLSKALRLTNSKAQPVRTAATAKNSENFVIPFIECDVETPKPSVPVHFCNFDISSVAEKNVENGKRPSKLGRALCRKYSRQKPYIVSSEELMYRRIKPFSFHSPSPDEIILKNLEKARKPRT